MGTEKNFSHSLEALIKALTSFKLTLFVLASLTLLTFFGTIYQAEHGLYMAQKVFFDSLIVKDGFLILPGVRLIMWLAFLNLSAFMIFKFKYSWKKFGLIISHLGLILLLIGGFYNLHYSKESLMTLREGEQSSSSQDYYKWEIKVLGKDLVDAVPIDISSAKLKPESQEKLSKVIPELKITQFMRNGRVFETPFAGTIAKSLPLAKEYEQNQVALVFENKSGENFYLDAFEHRYFNYSDSTEQNYKLILKRTSYEIPLIIGLENVERELHPNTQIAKSYASTVSVKTSPTDIARKAEISMNKPFRYKDYTFFQSGYGIDEDGQEFSSLAVVKNAGRLLPYIASLLTSLGLLLHSLIHLIEFIKRKSQA